MSAIPNTARAGSLTRFRLPRPFVALVLAATLAATTLAIVLLTAGGAGSDSQSSPAPAAAAQQRDHFGGHAEGMGSVQAPSPEVAANDGSDRFGARP